MIGVFKEEIHSVPCLVIVDAKMENQALPIVTYFHGFTSAKEHNLDTAYLLAEKGLRVILPDSLHHGEREDGISAGKRSLAFWDTLIQNIKELEMIKNYVDEKGLLLDGRFGVAGTSMGGITTAAGLQSFPWIKTAAIVMGSPKLTTFTEELINSYRKVIDLPVTDEEIVKLVETVGQYDLSKQMEKLAGRPLMFWHGESDSVVPFEHSYSFYQDAKELYANQDDIHFIREANRDHKVSRYAKLEITKWFEKHL
ncbi:prolyl oligopeptidase family serine peptidase [Oceanobacillus bengalensis]|uniref:Esterase n=1 Tax=Oceanobacillus bengalensis TaxID=1435466 RepID=A0A494Z8I3_9BACI|nr:prolyl oligopeptidase family serine peptidase [Oceanobacillus bengalensis]RKQ18847.1 esterase [Oceanobacillus bengalensis]